MTVLVDFFLFIALFTVPPHFEMNSLSFNHFIQSQLYLSVLPNRGQHLPDAGRVQQEAPLCDPDLTLAGIREIPHPRESVQSDEEIKEKIIYGPISFCFFCARIPRVATGKDGSTAML